MKKICAAVVLIICSFIIFIPQVSAQDMVWLYSDSERTDYVDNDTIERGGNYSDYDFGAVIVTYYSEYSKLSKSMGVSYIFGWYYFKNVNGVKYCRTSDLVACDSNGKVLSSNRGFEWEEIAEDTPAFIAYNKIYAQVHGK